MQFLQMIERRQANSIDIRNLLLVKLMMIGIIVWIVFSFADGLNSANENVRESAPSIDGELELHCVLSLY